MTPSITSTKAKTEFGSLIDRVHKKSHRTVITKNNKPYVVMISLEEYEDFLDVQDTDFNKSVKASLKDVKSGDKGDLENLYKIHKETIIKEAKSNDL